MILSDSACEEEQLSLQRWEWVEVAKEGSRREKLGRMFLKSVTVGVGRGGPELTHHIKPELLLTGHRLEPLCYTVTLGTQCFPPF